MKADKKSRYLGLTGVLIAVCALALCLVGCGGQSASSSAASSASSAAAESSAASEAASDASAEAGTISGESDGNDDVTVSEEFAQVSEISMDILENGASDDKTIDFNALPTSDDNEFSDVFKDFNLGAASDDATRAKTGTTWLTGGAIEVPIPGTWKVARRTNEFLFENSAGTVAGHLAWAAKKSGVKYDYAAMAKQIPVALSSQGATDVAVVDYSPLKTDNGVECGACICYAGKIKGNYFCFMSAVIGTKSWINLLEFAGEANSFKGELNTVLDSLSGVMYYRADM